MTDLRCICRALPSTLASLSVKPTFDVKIQLKKTRSLIQVMRGRDMSTVAVVQRLLSSRSGGLQF